ncbi:DotA/TraY family protein (plasmid) [Neptuniibacter sp. QD72_48]|uniref:DotA/TraY family protein n=1 Tax=Neptuniibacter sp. QD72_48 TaxID=3398214 RepID=UPI0039F4E226
MNNNNVDIVIPSSNLGLEDANAAGSEGAAGVNEFLQNTIYKVFDFDNDPIPRALEELLGTWVRLINDDGYLGELTTTLLMDILTYGNYIAIVLFMFTMLWVGYTAVLKTAAEGEVLGKQWSTIWLPLRTGLAMGLMYPWTIGYTASGMAIKVSAIQKIIVYLALVGSSAADLASNAMMERVSLGQVGSNALLTRQFDSVQDTETAKATCGLVMGFEKGTDPYWLVKNNLIWNDYESFKSIRDLEASSSYKSGTYDYIHFGSKKGVCGYTEIPESYTVDHLAMAKAPVRLEYQHTSQIKNGIGNNHPEEGGLFESVSSLQYYKTVNDQIREDLEKTAQYSLHQAVMNSVRTADDYVRPIVEANYKRDGLILKAYANRATTDVDALKLPNGQTFGEAIRHAVAMRYKQIIDNRVNFESNYRGILDRYNVVEIKKRMLTNDGWALAGMYYPAMAIDPNNMNTILSDNFTGMTKFTMPNPEEMGCRKRDDGYANNDYAYNKKTGGGDSTMCEVRDNIITLTAKLTSELMTQGAKQGQDVMANAELCNTPECAEQLAKQGADQMLKSMFTGLGVSDSPTRMTHGSVDYVEGIAGVDYIGDVADSRTLTMQTKAVSDGLFTKGMIFKAVSATFKVLAAGIESLGPFGAAASAAVVILAELLSDIGSMMIYGSISLDMLTFSPVLVWMLLVAGWLITVVEGVAAGPLAVVQMASPEGEGISGTRFERVWSLMAALLLKPVLCVVGLGAMLLFDHLGKVWTSLYIFGMAEAAGFNSYWMEGMITVFFIVSSAFMLKKIYEIPPQIPNNILEWFSGGVARPFGAMEANNVTDSAGSKAESLAQQAGGAAGSAHAAGAKQFDQARENQLKKKQGELEDGGR